MSCEFQGYHGHWWLSGEIPCVDFSVILTPLSLCSAAYCVDQVCY